MINFVKNYIIDFIFIIIILYMFNNQSYSINETKIPIKCLNQNPFKYDHNEKIFRYSDAYIDFEAFNNNDGTRNEYIVPNIYHYLIYKNNSNDNQYELTYSHYLSILSVVYFQQPQFIYIHYYGDDQNIDYITGKYWNELMNNKNVDNKIFKINKINYTKAKTIFEQQTVFEKHIRDLLRLEILIHYGGIYLDTDILLYNPIHYFRTFEISLFSTLTSSVLNINNSIIISNRNARFLKAYHDSYRTNFTPYDLNFNSQIYPAMILKNYTYLAHKSIISYLDGDKIDINMNQIKTLFLIKNQNDFVNIINKIC